MKKIPIVLISLFLAFSFSFLYSDIAYAGTSTDPSGSSTGNASDITSAKAGEQTLSEVAEQAGHNKVAINMIWVLIAGFLVMFMQAGFAMVEGGLTRAKNVSHTMAMNFLIYPLGMTGFFICGFAFMFGGVGPLATLGGFSGLDQEFTI